MKTLIAYPIVIYFIAGIACLCIMIVIDYLLGAEAEHLNAWVVVNRLFRNDISIPDSLAIRKLGLAGAALLTFAVNMLLGGILIQILRGIIRLFHS